MSRLRLAVLISGNGSNLQAIIDAIETGRLDADIVGVISNKKNAFGIQRAKKANLPVYLHLRADFDSRDTYDKALAELILTLGADRILLIGWMHLLSSIFLNYFPGKTVNLHPALPGMFPGIHAIERAYAAYQTGKIQHTGVMLHEVPDEGIDSGPVIAQKNVPIYPEDTLEHLTQRVHATEHALLIEQLQRFTGQY